MTFFYRTSTVDAQIVKILKQVIIYYGMKVEDYKNLNLAQKILLIV